MVLARGSLLLRVLIFTLLFLLLFLLAHRSIFDFDIWLHLKSGEWILEYKTVPKTDIFSFTVFGKPWVDHSWLFQLISYLVYKNFGFEGLIFLESAVVCIAFLFLLFSIYNVKEYNLVVLILFLGIVACQVRYNIRPDIFSLLFLSIYLFFLKKPIRRVSFYALFLIQILWVNFHGYFFLGPLLIFVFILEGFLAKIFEAKLPWQWSQINRTDPTNYIKLKRLFLLVILASLINPQFFKGAFYPLWLLKDILLGRHKLFFEDIQELKSIFGLKFSGHIHYLLLMIISLTVFILNYRKIKFSDLLLLFIFLPSSFIIRNISYFVFVASHIIHSNLEGLKRYSFLHKEHRSFWQKVTSRLMSVIFVLFVIYYLRGLLFSSYYDFQNSEFKSNLLGIREYNYPRKAVDFVLKEKLPPRMFNDFNSGAYLIGRAYPERLVFVDGRTELYGKEFHQNLRKIIRADAEVFNNTVKLYNITTVFISYAANPPAKDLLLYLYQNPSWKIVYLDESAIIFLKETSENKNLIERFQIDFNNWIVPAFDFTKIIKFVYPDPYIKRAEVLDILKQDEPLLKEVNEALKIMPNSSKALNLKGKAYLRKGLLEDAFLNFRAAFISSPRNLEIISNLAITYAKMGKYDKAIETFKSILKKDPKNLAAYKELVSLYKQKNELDKARQVLKRACKLYPKDKEIIKEIKELEGNP